MKYKNGDVFRIENSGVVNYGVNIGVDTKSAKYCGEHNSIIVWILQKDRTDIEDNYTHLATNFTSLESVCHSSVTVIGNIYEALEEITSELEEDIKGA